MSQPPLGQQPAAISKAFFVISFLAPATFCSLSSFSRSSRSVLCLGTALPPQSKCAAWAPCGCYRGDCWATAGRLREDRGETTGRSRVNYGEVTGHHEETASVRRGDCGETSGRLRGDPGEVTGRQGDHARQLAKYSRPTQSCFYWKATETPTVGLKPTTTRLRALRSTD